LGVPVLTSAYALLCLAKMPARSVSGSKLQNLTTDLCLKIYSLGAHPPCLYAPSPLFEKVNAAFGKALTSGTLEVTICNQVLTRMRLNETSSRLLQRKKTISNVGILTIYYPTAGISSTASRSGCSIQKLSRQTDYQIVSKFGRN
jgi:hypothetical protein